MSERTISQIVDEARDGGKPDYDELRLTVCCLDLLLTMLRQSITRLGRLYSEPRTQATEDLIGAKATSLNTIEMLQRSFANTPAGYLGEGFDPDCPKVQARRRKNTLLMQRLVERMESGEDAPNRLHQT